MYYYQALFFDDFLLARFSSSPFINEFGTLLLRFNREAMISSSCHQKWDNCKNLAIFFLFLTLKIFFGACFLLMHLSKPICVVNSGWNYICSYCKESFKNIAKNQRHRLKEKIRCTDRAQSQPKRLAWNQQFN